ncbi:MAG: TVP38/TMEM64 family protein [Nitrospira sp.]|nr:TVP38/TMEM64 family protein [Nitrospira sp.]
MSSGTGEAARNKVLMRTAARDRCVTKAQLLKVSALLFVIFGTYFLLQWLDIQEFLNPERIVSYLGSTGPFAPLVFMLLMATAVVISPIPSLPLDLAAGAAFGTVLGTTYAVIGAEIGAIASFLIGRALGREVLTRILRTDINFCERCSDRHLAIFVFLPRLIPLFSFDLVSYGAGLTNMSLKAFAVATLLGMIVPTYALTYAGSQVVSGEWLLIILGLVMVVVLLLIPKLVLRYPTARWVRLLRGDMPVATHVHVTPGQPPLPVLDGAPRCDSCGGPLP